MAGYDGYSKSNNAVNAEMNGYMTLTAFAKLLKVKTAQIKGIIEPDEWHHTSKMYNKTNYYDARPYITMINDNFQYVEDHWEDHNDFEEALKLYNKVKNNRPFENINIVLLPEELEPFLKKYNYSVNSPYLLDEYGNKTGMCELMPNGKYTAFYKKYK